jgi:hypothetical protein
MVKRGGLENLFPLRASRVPAKDLLINGVFIPIIEVSAAECGPLVKIGCRVNLLSFLFFLWQGLVFVTRIMHTFIVLHVIDIYINGVV